MNQYYVSTDVSLWEDGQDNCWSCQLASLLVRENGKKNLYHLLHLLYRIYNYSSILILQHRYLISFIASTLLYLLLQWCIINPQFFIYTTVVQKPPKLYLRQVQHVEENFVYTTAVTWHQNCNRCTMAGTYSIYYSGKMYPCHCIYDSGQPNLVKMPY